MWAFGVSLTRLFTLKWPYAEDIFYQQLVLGVARGELRPFCVQPEEVPDVEIVELINQCLSFDPKERPTFKEIVKRLNEALERCQKKQRQARSALVMNRKH